MSKLIGTGQTETDLGVQLVHLVSGEDYLGHVYFDPEDDQYIVERPIMIHVGLDQATQRLQINPMPLRPYLRKVDRVALDGDHVLWVKQVTEQMEDLWRQATSEIAIPTTGDLDKVLKPR